MDEKPEGASWRDFNWWGLFLVLLGLGWLGGMLNWFEFNWAWAGAIAIIIVGLGMMFGRRRHGHGCC